MIIESLWKFFFWGDQDTSSAIHLFIFKNLLGWDNLYGS